MKVLVAGLGGWSRRDTALEAFEMARSNGASVQNFKASKPLFKMWSVGDATTIDGMGYFTTGEGEPEPALIGFLDKNGKVVKGDA